MTSERKVITPGPDAPPYPGRRERKWQQVHDRLYQAAVALFMEHGFEATTMDAIGERADVARATVFNHFPQKVAFLEEWGVRRRARVAEILSSEHPGELPAGSRLRRYLRALADLNEESRAETTVLMDASAHFGRLLQDPSLGAELGSIVESGQRAGEIRPDADTSQTGSLLAAGYFVTITHWIGTDPAPFDLAQRLDGMLGLVLTGVQVTTAA
ncbi:TetR/AcrR family transcriptional regulator [Streptomyces sp. NPDC001617]